MLTPTIIGGTVPFDIKSCPIWAIPQLAFYKKWCAGLGIDIEYFQLKHGGGMGLVTVGLAGRGIYSFSITKWGMNEPEVSDLYPAFKPTRQMKVGDRVRSKNYNVEGVIQAIGPCSHSRYTGKECNEVELTLDPSEKGVQFYHHANHFEIVPE